MKSSYGYPDKNPDQFLLIMQSEKFQECWYITKYSVDDCKDCEFRYACLDCRCQVRNPDNRFSKPIKCEYKP